MEILKKPSDEERSRNSEIKVFWDKFIKFRKDNPFLEKNLRHQVSSTFETIVGSKIPDYVFALSSEAIMLFAYGANLARESELKLTEKLKTPEIEVKKFEGSFRHSFSYEMKTGVLISDRLEANVGHLTYPMNGWSFLVEPWIKSNKRSALSYVSDWSIVDIVIAGAEEYAHSAYIQMQTPEELLNIIERDKEIQRKFEAAKLTSTARDADILYHTKNIELRALLWQSKILRKHFPSWSEPTKKFIEDVRKKLASG
jgi:hypothetical protein